MTRFAGDGTTSFEDAARERMSVPAFAERCERQRQLAEPPVTDEVATLGQPGLLCPPTGNMSCPVTEGEVGALHEVTPCHGVRLVVPSD